jgi:ribulose-phosphate 3-epimerase
MRATRFGSGGSQSREVSASVMCADFSQLEDQFAALQRAGVDRLHLDFADGRFVPNIILGTEVFQLLPPRNLFFREAHLMVLAPERLLDLFIPHCDQVLFHVEATDSPEDCIEEIRSRRVRAGIALNPETPVERVLALLPLVDAVLVMTVHPGFAGSPFVTSSIEKVAQLHEVLSQRNLSAEIMVDGGINRATVPSLREAGADVFVGGSTGLFGLGDLERNARDLLHMVAGRADE